MRSCTAMGVPSARPLARASCHVKNPAAARSQLPRFINAVVSAVSFSGVGLALPCSKFTMVISCTPASCWIRRPASIRALGMQLPRGDALEGYAGSDTAHFMGAVLAKNHGRAALGLVEALYRVGAHSRRPIVRELPSSCPQIESQYSKKPCDKSKRSI